MNIKYWLPIPLGKNFGKDLENEDEKFDTDIEFNQHLLFYYIFNILKKNFFDIL